jgi:hypothetical protein
MSCGLDPTVGSGGRYFVSDWPFILSASTMSFTVQPEQGTKTLYFQSSFNIAIISTRGFVMSSSITTSIGTCLTTKELPMNNSNDFHHTTTKFGTCLFWSFLSLLSADITRHQFPAKFVGNTKRVFEKDKVSNYLENSERLFNNLIQNIFI